MIQCKRNARMRSENSIDCFLMSYKWWDSFSFDCLLPSLCRFFSIVRSYISLVGRHANFSDKCPCDCSRTVWLQQLLFKRIPQISHSIYALCTGEGVVTFGGTPYVLARTPTSDSYYPPFHNVVHIEYLESQT